MKVQTLALFMAPALALDNGMGIDPPMGWVAGKRDCSEVTAESMLKVADQLVSTGLQSVGYDHLVLNECWLADSRSDSERLQANEEAFPGGLGELASQLSERGIKLGVTLSAGTRTCREGKPGSQGFEAVDIGDLAEWGVQYIHVQDCYPENAKPERRFGAFSEAIQRQEVNMYYAVDPSNSRRWARSKGLATANQWTTGVEPADDFTWVEYNFRQNVHLAAESKRGGWVDFGTLQIGVDAGLTVEEERTHLALWSFVKSPLMLTCNFDGLREATLKVLLNPEIAEVNYDDASISAKCVKGCDWWSSLLRRPQVWTSLMEDGDLIVVVVNWASVSSDDFYFNVEDLGFSPKGDDLVHIRDLWARKDIGAFTPEQTKSELLVERIPTHGSKVFRFRNIRVD